MKARWLAPEVLPLICMHAEKYEEGDAVKKQS